MAVGFIRRWWQSGLWRGWLRTRTAAVVAVDVLAFPPTTETLERQRAEALSEAERIERRGSVARFVGVGMLISWVADVAAAFAPGSAGTVLVFGVASVVIALLVVAAQLLAEHWLSRAAARRRAIERRFAAITLVDAQPVLARAAGDAVIAQYLRMVGRQQRPLRAIELSALMRWTQAPARVGPDS